MGDPVYRSEQIGIRLVNRGSTYWSRFRRWLKAARGLLIAYVGVYVAIGIAFHTPWNAYVLGATATPAGGMQLLLGREPRLEFFVPRRSLSADQWTLLRRWLSLRTC